MRREIKQHSMNDEKKGTEGQGSAVAEEAHKTLTINLDLAIHNKLILAATKHGCSPEELVTQQISKLLHVDSSC